MMTGIDGFNYCCWVGRRRPKESKRGDRTRLSPSVRGEVSLIPRGICLEILPAASLVYFSEADTVPCVILDFLQTLRFDENLLRFDEHAVRCRHVLYVRYRCMLGVVALDSR